jgi:hypothetical protein
MILNSESSATSNEVEPDSIGFPMDICQPNLIFSCLTQAYDLNCNMKVKNYFGKRNNLIIATMSYFYFARLGKTLLTHLQTILEL